MQVTREDLGPCLVSFEIQVESEQYVSALERAKKEIAKRTEVPGFRKGKAPAAILEKFIDEDRVRRLAGDYVMPDAVERVLKDENINPWDSPSVEVLEQEPEKGFKFKTTVPLAPKVELGKYAGLDVERPVREVTDALVDLQLDHIRNQNARLEPAGEGSAIEDGDYVFIGIQELDDHGGNIGDEVHRAAVVGENLPDFDNGVRGMKSGEAKEFEINYPEDFPEEDRAGKTVKVKVTVSQHYKQAKPELTDEFVQQNLGQPNLEALKAEIRKEMERAFSQDADEKVMDNILRAVVEGSKIEYPPQMMQLRLRERLAEFAQDLKSRGMSVEEYLQRAQLTEDQLLGQLQARVDADIRVGLALGEIADKENIEATDEEISKEVEEVELSNAAERIKNYAHSVHGKNSIARRILARKTLDFLRSSSNIKDVKAPEPVQDKEAVS